MSRRVVGRGDFIPASADDCAVLDNDRPEWPPPALTRHFDGKPDGFLHQGFVQGEILPFTYAFHPKPSSSFQYRMLFSISSLWYSSSAALRSFPSGAFQGSRCLTFFASATNRAKSFARAFGHGFQKSSFR